MKNIFIRLGLCLALLVSGGVGCGAQERPDQMFFEVNGCRFEMVHVTGGEFMMGSKVEMSVAQSYKRGGEAVQVESKMTEEAGPMTTLQTIRLEVPMKLAYLRHRLSCHRKDGPWAFPSS